MTALGFVVTRFYEELAADMETQARKNAVNRGAEIAETVSVSGAYDTPLAADRLARLEAVDAVVVLGTAITGDTEHDRVVVHTAAQRLVDVSLDRDTPVTFGVTGPGMSSAEAHERVDYGAYAVDVACDLLDELPAASATS